MAGPIVTSTLSRAGDERRGGVGGAGTGNIAESEALEEEAEDFLDARSSPPRARPKRGSAGFMLLDLDLAPE